MADYGNATVVVRYGEQSDYSDNILNRALTYDSTTAVEYATYRFTATDTAYTVKISSFTTIQAIAIKNVGATNAVEVQWVSLAPVTGSTSNKQLLGAGAVMLLPSATAASELIFDCFTALTTEVEVIVFGI